MGIKTLGVPGQILPGTCWALAIAAALIQSRAAPADLPSQPHGWKFDVVRLHTGRAFQGLVLQETSAKVKFQCIWQNPGERTKLGPVAIFARQEILRIEPLEQNERAELAARLEKLKPASEEERMANIELEPAPAPWRGQAQGALSYRAAHFVLISNAREDIVRRTAVRLEQIYEAYARFLPPRCQKAEPTQIVLVRSLVEYRHLLKKQMSDMLNPAFFDPLKNQIVCASKLEELANELDMLRKKHQELRNRLNQLRKVNKPAEELRQLRIMIEKADEENARTFARATERLFQTLYHEAFHAYLASFVYPPAAQGVPRWLNEGLAQIFETAILEAGELRVGHADSERLIRVKDALRKNHLVAVEDLLKAAPDKFLVSHANNQQVSDDYYLSSWALAFYLTFGQRKLGTPELDEYVRSLRENAGPLQAFCKLVGAPLPAFEESFHRYLRTLRTDGGTTP